MLDAPVEISDQDLTKCQNDFPSIMTWLNAMPREMPSHPIRYIYYPDFIHGSKVGLKLCFMNSILEIDIICRGYGINDEGNMAIKCFKDMRKQNVRPDATTFIRLLTACGRDNLVSKCKEYFKRMATEYGITPTSDHYICLVDHLALSGNLYEALKPLESVSYPLPKGRWTSLLNACRTYGEVELGLKCFQHLIQLDLEGAIPYMLMANFYAATGMLDHANRIEELRKNAGAKKSLAKAVIEVNGTVHLFSVGSEKSWEISAMLQILSSRLKSEGYVPNIELVLGSASAGEKEMALCGHAEKLTIAFGLLHTPQGKAPQLLYI